ncbi:MAG: TetR/AcrR family transcriptional regulator, partial [Proteobacteria bacterium]|nr:TetR/AcrR family transcriptional regulator [Pseudomonadota bacterium]
MNELVHGVAGRKSRSAAPARKPPGRTNDPERTQANILEVAEA